MSEKSLLLISLLADLVNIQESYKMCLTEARKLEDPAIFRLVMKGGDCTRACVQYVSYVKKCYNKRTVNEKLTSLESSTDLSSSSLAVSTVDSSAGVSSEKPSSAKALSTKSTFAVSSSNLPTKSLSPRVSSAQSTAKSIIVAPTSANLLFNAKLAKLSSAKVKVLTEQPTANESSTKSAVPSAAKVISPELSSSKVSPVKSTNSASSAKALSTKVTSVETSSKSTVSSANLSAQVSSTQSTADVSPPPKSSVEVSSADSSSKALPSLTKESLADSSANESSSLRSFYDPPVNRFSTRLLVKKRSEANSSTKTSSRGSSVKSRINPFYEPPVNKSSNFKTTKIVKSVTASPSKANDDQEKATKGLEGKDVPGSEQQKVKFTVTSENGYSKTYIMICSKSVKQEILLKRLVKNISKDPNHKGKKTIKIKKKIVKQPVQEIDKLRGLKTTSSQQEVVFVQPGLFENDDDIKFEFDDDIKIEFDNDVKLDFDTHVEGVEKYSDLAQSLVDKACGETKDPLLTSSLSGRRISLPHISDLESDLWCPQLSGDMDLSLDNSFPNKVKQNLREEDRINAMSTASISQARQGGPSSISTNSTDGVKLETDKENAVTAVNKIENAVTAVKIENGGQDAPTSLIKNRGYFSMLSVNGTPVSNVPDLTKFLENCKEYKQGFPCLDCGKYFELKDALKRHKKEFHKRKVHKKACKKEFEVQCHLCGQVVVNRQMRKHLRQNHPGEACKTHKQRFQCDKCPDAVYNLERHKRLVHRGHQCEDCGKRFKWKCEMEKHINEVHLKLVYGSCDICNRGFGQRTSLLRHYVGVHRFSPAQLNNKRAEIDKKRAQESNKPVKSRGRPVVRRLDPEPAEYGSIPTTDNNLH